MGAICGIGERAPANLSNEFREKTKKTKIPRELKNLQWGLMYNKEEVVEGQESMRRLRGTRDCA